MRRPSTSDGGIIGALGGVDGVGCASVGGASAPGAVTCAAAGFGGDTITGGPEQVVCIVRGRGGGLDAQAASTIMIATPV